MELYSIVIYGDGYETFNRIIGYADNKDTANHMVKQARILHPHDDIGIEQIEHVNFLLE